MTKVTIIMTSYNKPKFIGKAIEAIMNQTFNNFELLLMDDNSNEETQKVIHTFLHDQRIKFFRSNTNSIEERAQKVRYAVLINKALKEAKGKYISYATDDNMYLPERVEKMVDFLDTNKNAQIVYSASKTTYIDGDEKPIKVIERPAQQIQWVASCAIDHCSIMHRKAILEDIYNKWGGYWDENPEFYRIGDARFFWKLNHYWPFYPINEILDDNYITHSSIHHQLYSEEDNKFVTLLPPQRTCKELREDIKKYLKSR